MSEPLRVEVARHDHAAGSADELRLVVPRRERQRFCDSNQGEAGRLQSNEQDDRAPQSIGLEAKRYVSG
jgi:hypothetical protein